MLARPLIQPLLARGGRHARSTAVYRTPQRSACTVAAVGPLLSSANLAQYAADGFTIPERRLSAGYVNRLRDALDELLRRNPGKRPEQLVSIHNTDGGAGRENAEGVVGSAVFRELCEEPAILDCVEQILGPGIILWGCQVFCKPGDDGMAVPMHQDGHYWPIRPLATCTVWVAIDDSDAENACLRVVPGTHKHADAGPNNMPQIEHYKSDEEHIVLNQTVVEGSYDEADAVDVELEAGQFSMHDVNRACCAAAAAAAARVDAAPLLLALTPPPAVLHGSESNTSGKRRAGVAIRYMPSTSEFVRGAVTVNDDGDGGKAGAGYKVDFSTRPLWLLRGEGGVNDFEVGK